MESNGRLRSLSTRLAFNNLACSHLVVSDAYHILSFAELSLRHYINFETENRHELSNVPRDIDL
jgi:hypothetical protein